MRETGTSGYGQQSPNDSSNEFNTISFIVRQMMAQMDTMKLVQVKAVHGGAGAIDVPGTVDVLPLVNQINGRGQSTPMGTVFGIPWFRNQGGQNAIIIDPVVGDIGYVVAADRDISKVKATKAQADPGSWRRFNISDGVYVGGCLNVAPNQYLVFTSTGCRLADLNGNVVSMDSGGIAVTPKGGQPVTINGDLHVTGEVTAKFGGSSVTLSGHKHTQPNDSHGDVEQPTAAPTAGT